MLELLLAVAGVVQADDSRLRSQTQAECIIWSKWALETGVIEPSEAGRFFTYYGDWDADTARAYFEGDRDCLLDRLAETTPDTPPASDLHRLPPKDTCYECRLLASRYLDQLNGLRAWSNAGEQQAIDREVDRVKWRYKLYDLMCDCHCNWGTRGRRLLLQDLKKHCGDRLYESAEWPSPVTPNATRIVWRNYK